MSASPLNCAHSCHQFNGHSSNPADKRGVWGAKRASASGRRPAAGQRAQPPITNKASSRSALVSARSERPIQGVRFQSACAQIKGLVRDFFVHNSHPAASIPLAHNPTDPRAIPLPTIHTPRPQFRPRANHRTRTQFPCPQFTPRGLNSARAQFTPRGIDPAPVPCSWFEHCGDFFQQTCPAVGRKDSKTTWKPFLFEYAESL